MPARSRSWRWRETTEKSTEQHSATSVTEQARPHLARHARRAARVGSQRALKRSVLRRWSMGPQQAAACLGEEGLRARACLCVRTCVIMQILDRSVGGSRGALSGDQLPPLGVVPLVELAA